MRLSLGATLLSLAVLASARVVTAQTYDTPPPMSLRITGDAQVSAAPDLAEMEVGVITRGDTARRATDENASKTTRVMAAIKEQLGTAGTAETLGRPFVDMARPAALAAESTPVEPQTVDVEARVLLILEVGGR
jgi:uncharacterized protein YggE